MAVQEMVSFDALSSWVMQRALEMNFNKTSGQLVLPAAVIMAAAHLTLQDLEDGLKAHPNALFCLQFMLLTVWC